MKYDDLEKTKDLFDIIEEVPTPIENIEMEGASKENLTDEITLDFEEEPKEEKKVKKPKNNRKKLIIIICILLILIVGCAVALYFLLKEDKEPVTPEEPKEPIVIIEKDNYIYKNGVLTFIDSEDNELGTYSCKNEDENLCYVINYNDEDNFNGAKNVYTDESLVERRSAIYLNKYVFIYDNSNKDNGVIILYNIEESKNEGIYTLVKGFNDSNYVILKNSNDKYGAIEFTEEGIDEKIEFKFDYLGLQDKDSKVVAKTNNKYFIYSIDGKLESKGLSYEIKNYNDKYIVVDNDGYYVYDYKSNLVFDDSYEYIKLLDNYAILFNEDEVYIKDYDNNKYNEEGINIYNTEYEEMNIFDKNKEYLESNKYLKINEVENKIELTYFTKTKKEKTVTIDLNEGKFSSKLEYLNYLDGKLYFYNDEEKEKLIGIYECSNKNTITKDTTELTTCTIASESFYSKNEVEIDNSESLGWIPIFNKRFVFIKDAIDLNNPTIMLYDLEEQDILSKYLTLDTGTYTKENKLTFKDLDEIYIMSENKNNKFGIIKITDEISRPVEFKYSKMEKLKEYIMVKETTETYLLIDKEGNEITSKYGYKIVDYKGSYLKTIDNNNKYYIYDFKGNKIEETGYLHIDLYEDYYVVINAEGKLDIHKYDNNAFKLSSTIDLGTTEYKNAYEVGKSDKGFTIKIKSTGEIINTDEFGVLEKDKVEEPIETPETPSEEQKPTEN